MALLFYDGFGHVDDSSADYIMLKWDVAYSTSTSYLVYESSYGSDGGWGLRLSTLSATYIGKNLPSPLGTIVFGMKVKLGSYSDSNQFLMILDAGSNQLEVRALSNGSIAVYRGSTQIAVSATALVSTDTWFSIGFKILLSQTVGTVDVVLDGVSIISDTGLDTCSTANETVDQVRIYSNSGYVYPDDFYIFDTTGSKNNSIPTDGLTSKLLYPTSDGTYSQFTPSTGSDHYALVDDPQLTADTDHNESSTIGHKDSYGMTTYSESGTILGVQICAAVKNTDAGAMNVRTLCRSGGTPADNEGSDVALSATMKGAITVYEQEPTDTVDWTAAKINAAEFGLKVQS